MNNINSFIEKYYQKAIDLKRQFRITESKKWDSMTVLNELNVQLGHLSYLLSKNKEYGEKNRNINNIGDEISDVILQLFALCDKSKVDLKSYFQTTKDKNINFENPQESILALSTILGQINEIVMEIKGYRHYKIRYDFCYQKDFLLHNIAKMIEIIFYLGNTYNLDLNIEFENMLKDASNFLDNYTKNKNIKYYPIVDVHATWLVLNPIQGCPKKCKYCFLGERGLNCVKPNILVSPEEAVKLLIKNKFYTPNMPLCLESQSDAFSTKENIEYVTQLIKILMKNNIKNPIIFITKCHIPIEFIKLIDKYEKQGHKFIFFLSYSGLPKEVEIGVDKKLIEENFINLKKYNKLIIHYWRPFIKANSNKETIDKVYNFVKKYSVASIAIGLKANSDSIINNIEWPELKQHREDVMIADNVWEKNAYEYIWNELKNNDDEYPIFQTTSCALGYALSKPDRKFFYTTSICKCNKCPKKQQQRCELKYKNYKEPSKKQIIKILKRLNYEIDETQIEIKNHIIFLTDIKLNFNEISFLTDYLNTQIICSKIDDYYWNTSINNSKILKL